MGSLCIEPVNKTRRYVLANYNDLSRGNFGIGEVI